MVASLQAAPRVIEITGDDRMKFDVVNITASPGEEITIVLKNIGKLSKEIMGHNLVVLKSDADPVAYAMAAVSAAGEGFLPSKLSHQVIAHTRMLGPNESDSITFTVPEESGDYPYLCSFPAHCLAGMKGFISVR